MDRNRLAQVAWGTGILVLSALTYFGYGWSEAGLGLRLVGVLALATMLAGFALDFSSRRT